MKTYPLPKHPLSRESVKTPVGQASLTRQEFKHECDVNNVLAKFQKTQIIEHLNRVNGASIDNTLYGSYQESMNIVINAEKAFKAIPSKLRKMFDNDPSQYLAFTTDPANLDKMRELGLAKPLPLPDAPISVIVTNTTGETVKPTV